jgi:glycosyltransferase involved in cell wall biosynthesis
MQVVFIDPEPPSPTGGGIRTYLSLALDLCRRSDIPARIYTHNPGAYPGADAAPIGRRPWLPFPLRGLAYRASHSDNVLWEHAAWLGLELAASHAPGRVYEFADYQGYAFYALRHPRLRPSCVVRVHTPAFLIPDRREGLARLAGRMSAWRERDCLERAARLAAPSAEFMREKLPAPGGWTHVPNLLPPDFPESGADSLKAARSRRAEILAAAAAGFPSGPPPGSGDAAWSAAPPDPAAVSEEIRKAARPDRILPARFLYLGRIEPRKGALPLVRAFARAAADRPFAYLTLAGPAADDAYVREVRAAVADLPEAIRNRILWEGTCPPSGKAALFDRHTALVVPSLWENSPYVYFEGMAAGLACIGSATGEMKAVARETGAPNPPPGDEARWAEALEAHCDGKDAGLADAQRACLATRRRAAEAAVLSSWREAAGEAA